MKQSRKTRLTWALITGILFAIELVIALFGTGFVRAYVGDILVIPLLAAGIRIPFPEKPKLLALYLIFTGVIAELLQYFQFADLLGVTASPIGTLLGTTFDLYDILCYILGGTVFFVCERLIKNSTSEP